MEPGRRFPQPPRGRPVRENARTMRASLAAVLVLMALGALQPPGAFLQAAEWGDKHKLNSEDSLPLVADCTFDVATGDGRKVNISAMNGRGSYIADFGVVDFPYIGEIRSRAGLRYSRLYPHGALELGFRKELRSDRKRGYELTLGCQTAGDDRRLDVLADAGAVKNFKHSRAFYKLRMGVGHPFQGRRGGPKWNEVGSSVGVTQIHLMPNKKGELTVGWCSGLFDGGLEGEAHPTKRMAWPRRGYGGFLTRRSEDDDSTYWRKGDDDESTWRTETKKDKDRRASWQLARKYGLLDSTPYAAYGVDMPAPRGCKAHLSCTLLPRHNNIKHALDLKMRQDKSGGSATFSVLVDQSISDPRRCRLRVGTSYTRDR